MVEGGKKDKILIVDDTPEIIQVLMQSEKSRRTAHGISGQSARSGRTGRVVEHSLRAAPDAAAGGDYERR